jgi:hypothetical protein
MIVVILIVALAAILVFVLLTENVDTTQGMIFLQGECIYNLCVTDENTLCTLI